jgi:predicted ATP-binding protein involved in virulence
MELTSFKFNGIHHQFTQYDEDDEDNDSNKFTLLLGENGSGKSEVIREIINILLRMQISDIHTSKHNDKLDNYLENRYKSTLRDKNISAIAKIKHNKKQIIASFMKTNEDRVVINFNGEKEFFKDSNYRYRFDVDGSIGESKLDKSINIVAVSESPYIKFPIIQSDESLNYYYIGKKQEKDYDYMDSRSDDYVDNKMEQLAKSMFQTLTNSEPTDISNVLDFLSFSRLIQLDIKIKSKYSQRSEKTTDLINEIFSATSRFSSLGIKKIHLDKKEKNKLEQAINYIKNNSEYDSNNTFNSPFNIKSKTINIDITNNSVVAKHISLLFKYDLINVSKLRFSHNDVKVDAIQLSSGQLCILNNFFGIASKIADDSFIFIDEPEISLHPSWQANFIQLLEKTFNNYKNCHFILATHSPHIISNINENNSHVVFMDENGSTTVNGDYGCKGWTVEEILQDVMGMSDTRSKLYNSLIKSFNHALDENDAELADKIFKQLSTMLHPQNVLRRVLEIQMIGVGEDD